MSREDISNVLIHWTSGATDDDAFDVLYEIVSTNVIIGSSNMIRGSHTCICFTETPARHFSFHKRHYKPFGVSFTKKYLFDLGGRPVIYESEQEYSNLPEILQWRHVYYNPCLEPPIDFTWEREWRIKEDLLYLDSDEVIIIVPDDSWADELVNRFYSDENYRYDAESVGYGESNARWPEKFPYTIIPISEVS